MADHDTIADLRELLDQAPERAADLEAVRSRYRRRHRRQIAGWGVAASVVLGGAAVVLAANLAAPADLSPAGPADQTTSPDGSPSPTTESPTPTTDHTAPADPDQTWEPSDLSLSVSDDPESPIDPNLVPALQEFVDPMGGQITLAWHPDGGGPPAGAPVHEEFAVAFPTDGVTVSWQAQGCTPELWGSIVSSYLAEDLHDYEQVEVNGLPAVVERDSDRVGVALTVFDPERQIVVYLGAGSEDGSLPDSYRTWVSDQLLPRVLDRSLAG